MLTIILFSILEHLLIINIILFFILFFLIKSTLLDSNKHIDFLELFNIQFDIVLPGDTILTLVLIFIFYNYK